MQYPLMSEYVSAVRDASDNLDELAHLVPVLDDHGEPYRSSGAFAVVFKMKDEQTGKCYALKCFLEEQEGRAEAYRLIADELDCVDSSYVTSVKYLEKEIFVDSSCEEDEFPVLLMDWVEGETMDTYVANNYQDEYAMGMLCYRFCKMAAWLRSQPFAHGDIKPDNIIVRPDGTLTLVDYDGMFVPAMKGQKSPTVGTKDFSHPLRTIDDFDETIDDFALASIALSLKAIFLKPSLLDEYGAADRLLFSADDYRDLSKSKVMAALQELMNDEELTTLLSMFLLANAKKNLVMCSFRLFSGNKPELKMEFLSTEVTDEDLKDAVMDEYGVKYSKDGKKLLKAPENLVGIYKIKISTQVICNCAFGWCKSLSSVVIPDNVKSIGYSAFFECNSLSNIIMPKGLTSIADYTFSMCSSLSNIVIPNKVTSIGNSAFAGCSSLSQFNISDSIISLGNNIFGGCKSLSDFFIPQSVSKMNGNPFAGWYGALRNLSTKYIYDNGVLFDDKMKTIIAFRRKDPSYRIPNSVIKIGGSAFSDCESLSSIVIPDSVTSIGDGAFWGCKSLSNMTLPNKITSIGDCLFSGCESLPSIDIPDSVTSIGDSAFAGCKSLSSVIMSNNVTCIDSDAFSDCESLSSIVIPDSVTSIGDGAFWGCKSLSNMTLPNKIISIGDCLFSGCESLSSIDIPDSVTSIGDSAFAGCKSLPSVIMSNNVACIDNYAFSNCESLSVFLIKISTVNSGNLTFMGFVDLGQISAKDIRIGSGAFVGCRSLNSSIKNNVISRFGKEVFEE